MNCSFQEKVSMLIDDELSEAESKQIRAHIADCAQCLELEKEFLFFREQIKDSASEAVAGRMKTPVFPKPRQTRKKGISVPIPVLAGFIVMIVAVSIWLIVFRGNQAREIAVEYSVKKLESKPESAPSEISIARFDKGGRAEIYVVQREAVK